jgi:Asp/Glu/hydantoin racemase
MITLIHTSASMIPVLKKHTDELLPGRTVVNVVDESLLCDIRREGKLIAHTARRLVNHVLSAADAGATHILVTCSSMGPAVEAAQLLTTACVLRIDDAMAFHAVGHGRRVGVVATLPSTLSPTVALIERKARDAGKEIAVNSLVVPDAFNAVIAGDAARHDTLVGDAVTRLIPQVDVLVLAQASMARVVDALPDAVKTIPILSSPRRAVEALAARINTIQEHACR